MSHTEGPCGCFLSHRSGGLEDPDIIEYCPLHAEAPAMLAALKEPLAVDDRRRHPLGMPDEGIAYDAAAASANARGAISRAEGKS